MRPDWLDEIDNDWTLFLDRDGVINQRLPGDYVKRVEEFEFLPGALEAIRGLSQRFGVVVVVTNQQGIGKGIMTTNDLLEIHKVMRQKVSEAGGRLDNVYFCPELASADPECRKPNTGMGLQAKKDFPEIEFTRSVMVGDSPSDMEFGQRLDMHTVYIGQRDDGLSCDSLVQFARLLSV